MNFTCEHSVCRLGGLVDRGHHPVVCQLMSPLVRKNERILCKGLERLITVKKYIFIVSVLCLKHREKRRGESAKHREDNVVTL